MSEEYIKIFNFFSYNNHIVRIRIEMPPKRVKNTKYFKGKDAKIADINRALTTRARRRIAYFKMLKEEGFSVPEKQTKEEREAAQQKRKAMSFQERMKIKKERKTKERDERFERNQQKMKEIREKASDRQKKTELMKNAKTKKGQPLMGPRIGSLLDKIKADKGI